MKKEIVYILKALVIGLIFLFFTSCDVMKEASKNKTNTNFKGSEENRLFREGDSVSYRPVINNPIYKDTTIYRVTKNNTRLETVYDSNGNIRDINCYTDKIEELSKRNFDLEQDIKEKESKKTEDFDNSFILYIVLGVVVLGMFGMILMFLLILKNTKAVTTLASVLERK